MQHFILLIGLFWLIAISSIILTYWLQNRHIRKICINNLVARSLLNYPLFSSLAVKEITARILKKSRQQQRKLLSLFSEQKFSSLIRNGNDKTISNILKIIVNNSKIHHHNNNFPLLILCSQQAINYNDFVRADNILKKIDDTSVNIIHAAAKLFIEAQIAFHEGDLLNASAWAVQTVTIYQKKHYLYEEAQTDLLLGHIYAAGEQVDSAYFMFRRAAKIFKQLNSFYKTAEALIALGELTASQNRLAEAEDFFNDSLAQASYLEDKNLTHAIICRQALLNIANGRPNEALQTIKSIPSKTCTKNILALMMDISAQAHCELKNSDKARRFAQKAIKYYSENDNLSAIRQIQTILNYREI